MLSKIDYQKLCYLNMSVRMKHPFLPEGSKSLRHRSSLDFQCRYRASDEGFLNTTVQIHVTVVVFRTARSWVHFEVHTNVPITHSSALSSSKYRQLHLNITYILLPFILFIFSFIWGNALSCAVSLTATSQ